MNRFVYLFADEASDESLLKAILQTHRRRVPINACRVYIDI